MGDPEIAVNVPMLLLLPPNIVTGQWVVPGLYYCIAVQGHYERAGAWPCSL